MAKKKPVKRKPTKSEMTKALGYGKPTLPKVKCEK